MTERLRFVIAGFFVGLAELLPGISGSTVAIAIATVDPDIPGRSSARPTKKPAITNLNLSVMNHFHQQMFLKALAQKQPLQIRLL